MTVLNFSYATIKNREKFREYVTAAAILMEEAGVEIVVRGNYSTTMRGEQTSEHIAAVFRYTDKAAVDAFYSLEKYQLLIPLRDEACDMTINIYEED